MQDQARGQETMKKHSSDKHQLYTSGEVIKLLDISSSTLRSLVEKGLIEKVIPIGYKHGYYTKKSVDHYLEEKQLFDEVYLLNGSKEKSKEIMTLTRKKFNFSIIKVKPQEELKECVALAQEIFGTEVGRGMVEERMKIIERNPDTYYLLRRDREPIGYFSIMPLKRGNLENVLGQVRPVIIEPEQIEAFEKGKYIDLYLTGRGTKPSFSLEEKREYGSTLVRHLIRLIIGLGEKGVEIGVIAARSNMPDGLRLMRHLGFTEIEPLTPERRTFLIKVKESGIPFVMRYKKALKDTLAATSNVKA